jgi:hypothetical protein
MEDFVTRSSAALNRIVDHIASLESKSDIRKYNDLYLHLLKIQRRAVDAKGDDASRRLFDREWSLCEAALDGAEDYDDSPAEQPTEQQLDEFKKTVAAWFQLDDEEKQLKKRAGERAMLKKRLTSSVVSFMQRFDIEALNTRDGQGTLKFFRREVSKMPAKSVQMQRISDFFGDPGDAERFATTVFKAETVERCGVRRVQRRGADAARAAA